MKSFDLRSNPEDRTRAYDQLVSYMRIPDGVTIQSVADKFNVSYWTARTHVFKLMDEKRVEKVPGFGKATYYRAVDYNGMPEILGQKLWYVVNNYANADNAFDFTQYTRAFLYHISRLFYYAGLQFDTGDGVKRKELNELKQLFIRDRARAEKYLEAVTTILNHDELFANPDSLMKALMHDSDAQITSQQIDQAVGIHRARFETHKDDV